MEESRSNPVRQEVEETAKVKREKRCYVCYKD